MTLSSDIRFRKPTFQSNSLTCTDDTGRYFLKVQLCEEPLKANDLIREKDIITLLNNAGCVSCPGLVHQSTFSRAEVERLAGGTLSTSDGRPIYEQLPFLILDLVPAARQVRIPDLLLSLIEQKSLGVYHGDLTPSNCRFDDEHGILYLVDYDQAELLDNRIRALGNVDFLRWCNRRAQEKYKWPTPLPLFQDIDFDRHVLPLFRDDALDLGRTSLWTRQKTTLSEAGIYHRIAEKAVFADGERGIEERQALLDSLDWVRGERVLDVGCNTGLLSRHLFDRGCLVTGIDLDPFAVTAARIVGNIVGKRIDYQCIDIDEEDVPGDYDTVILFSVLHHTINPEASAAKLARRCRRVIIECRLVETGAKPVGEVWRGTSQWRFASLEELVGYLERLFSGFRLRRNLGKGDRERYVLELVRA